MAHSIWNGSINFGLVTIPVKLLTAVRTNELAFHLLHKADGGRIHNERVCDACGKKVDWSDLVRGYEYERGEYVILTDEDLARANVEASRSVDIVEFASLGEIDPMLFDVPYYLEPERKGRHAYVLLREALKRAGKVGVARVVLRAREHLAALRPNGRALVVETMHWADEIVAPSMLDLPREEDTPAAELRAANMLIDAMTTRFDPTRFHDRYREQLTRLIEARAQGRPAPKAKGKARPPSRVVDLVSILKRSLAESKKHAVPVAKAAHEHGRAKHPAA
jgi:DNA end-binding protein Ku